MYNQIFYSPDAEAGTGGWYDLNCTVKNREGLHTSPMMDIVDIASGYLGEVRILKPSERKSQDAKSIMHLMLLTAEKDVGLTVRVERRNGAEVGLAEKIREIIEAE